jgi:NADH-quinone oxidoreductase subunit H
MVDGLKLVMKEDLIPGLADRPLFKLAPVLVLASASAALACLPYSDRFYIADLNIGIFYLAAITSLEVIGILMAGWASNNKWALLGGMRSAAQMVSYELPAGLCILTAVLVTGSLSMQALTASQFGAPSWQQGWFWQWNVFASPFLLLLFPVYFLTGLAECNRTPFDIPEAESELVAGYHTEYSGIRFGFFFMSEYVMMCVMSGVAVTMFLGGWSTGIGVLETKVLLLDESHPDLGFHGFGTAIHLLAFCAKTGALVFLMMWIRWTVPRFRVDQLMELCWKKLIPISLFGLTGAALWTLFRPSLATRVFGAGRTPAEAAAALDTVTGCFSLVLALSLLGWLVWFFRKPLNPEDQVRWQLMPQANPEQESKSLV